MVFPKQCFMVQDAAGCGGRKEQSQIADEGRLNTLRPGVLSPRAEASPLRGTLWRSGSLGVVFRLRMFPSLDEKPQLVDSLSFVHTYSSVFFATDTFPNMRQLVNGRPQELPAICFLNISTTPPGLLCR